MFTLRRLAPAALALTFASACTEKGTAPVTKLAARDTSYAAATEAAQQRRVMIEEFTGVTCPNCPAGHTDVATLQSQYPDRVVAVSYYIFGLGQSKPVEGVTRQDFRLQKTTDAASAIFGGVPGLPSASIDRVPVNGVMLPARNSWAGAVTSRLPVATDANVSVSSVWEESGREAVITARVAFTKDVTRKQALTLLITESGIVDAQEYPDRIDSNYTFKHVLRDFVSSPTGDPVLDSLGTKPAGRVFERRVRYTLPTGWNPDKCSVIAVLHSADAGTREVTQAAEAKLK